MANSPKDEKPENSPSGVDENSYAINPELHTIEDMGATPQYIKALERERLARELDALRPRYVKAEKSSADQTSELAGLLNSAISQIAKPSHQISVDRCAIGTIYKGRVFLKDATQLHGWTSDTPLSFSYNANDGITITGSSSVTKNSGHVDSQNRCVIPSTARKLLDLEDGSNVLMLTSCAPIEHVRIIPISLVLEALAEKESK